MQSNISQKKEKMYMLLKLSSVLLGTVVVIFVIFLYKNDIKMFFNNLFFSTPIESLELTIEEKIADFDSFYEIVTTSFPNMDEVKNTYSIDFKEKKNYYINLIKQTDNDFEYYCTMTAIIEDLASYHTGFCFPDYESIKALNCYNLSNVLADKNLKSFVDYWNDVIKDNCEKYSDINAADFKYIDGKYIFDSKWSSEKYDNLQGYHIVSINNVNIDDYMLHNISIYKTQYDTKENKPYKRVITLNESVGEKIQVIFENENGDKIEKELYTSLKMEIINTYYPNYSNKSNSSSVQNIIYNYDNKNDILYVGIKNFKNTDGEKLKDIFKNIGDNTKVIIDLRDNFGGNPNYAKKYIYPYLYNKSVSFEQSWFVPSSKLNDKESKKFLNNLLYKIKSIENGFIYDSETKYKGNDKDYSNNIYYLINKATASAADEYIAMVKENKLGTIIGTNTAGEGLGGSFTVDMLKNSGWVFTYYPCKTYDSDKNNNSIFGTAPDIYITQSTDSFNKQRELEDNNVDIELYENRLIWDNILTETIDIIKSE